jgi:hypothetical protein
VQAPAGVTAGASASHRQAGRAWGRGGAGVGQGSAHVGSGSPRPRSSRGAAGRGAAPGTPEQRGGEEGHGRESPSSTGSPTQQGRCVTPALPPAPTPPGSRSGPTCMRRAPPMAGCGTSPSPPISLEVSTITTRLCSSSAELGGGGRQQGRKQGQQAGGRQAGSGGARGSARHGQARAAHTLSCVACLPAPHPTARAPSRG